jgi:hypothetical protein
MTRVVLVGYDPETVDFSDPALPPGMNAEKIRAGIEVTRQQFAERGWEADVVLIRPDETAGPTIESRLASKSYDCVVIGAGRPSAASARRGVRSSHQCCSQRCPRRGDCLQHTA